MIIESKAPTRVDLAGATLDIWPLYLFHPGALTVNAAISRYASCVIETNAPGNEQIKLVSRDTKREESFTSLAALAKAGRYRLPLLAEIVKFFQPAGGEHRVELRLNLDELERRIVVCYTGKPRQHGINNWEVFKAHINGKRAVQNSMEKISKVAQLLRVALEATDWNEAGRLMREEWFFRKRNLPTISTKLVDRVIEGARKKGALAGKVCGAGGGGCVVLLIEPDARQRVEASIRDVGAEVLPVKIDRQGVQVVSR